MSTINSEIRIIFAIANQNGSLAYQGNLSELYRSFEQNLFSSYNLTITQKVFIHQMLQISEKHPEQALQLTDRIIECVINDVNCLCFIDESTPQLTNAYPCTIEFGGKYYRCAEAAFQAQKYTDQPQMMDLLTSCDAEEAINLANHSPMTVERKHTWEDLGAIDINQDDVMLHVLWAKFEQNPALREKLLETGSSFLESHDGPGLNILGLSLMCLREEYNTQIMLDRCGSITNNLSHDIILSIFQACLNLRDAKTIGALALLNKNFNRSIPCVSAMKPEEIYKVCPRMRVVDAKVISRYNFEINDEPSLNPSQILQFYREMISHIEGKAGVMLLTLWKGLNPHILLSIADRNGIEVVDDTSGDLEKAEFIPLEETIVVMMPNDIFKNSRNKTCAEQNEDVLRPLGCEMATLTATTALWFFTYTLSRSKIWLFNDVLEGTYIRTSETIEQEGDDNKKHLCFEADCSGKLIFSDGADKVSSDACGVIGMRKLDGRQKVIPIELKPNKRRVSSPIIKHAVQLAIQGNLNEAFEVFNKYDFNKAQIRTIDQLLPLCQQYPNEAPKWQSQLAYLVKEAVDSVRFTENPPTILANAYPCIFEFSGKTYYCAEAAFQAQKYTDQPQIMDLFTSRDAEDAIDLAALKPMTDDRRRSWENPFEEHLFKDNVLMHVLRAKFGQNPFLKDVLLDTESSHLVCQGNNQYLNQDTDGEGINILGLSLMCLREEYKG